MSIVYLNGKYIPEDQATISVLDRGFIFGDGVYEVIPVYNKVPFRIENHLFRLDFSLSSIRLENPLSHKQWCNLFSQLISKNNITNSSIYLQITRGPAKRDHAIPKTITPTVFAMFNSAAPIKNYRQEGIRAITLEDTRWQLCHIKAITLLANILLKQQAIESDADEAILVRQGRVTEGTATSLFIVKNGTIFTPSKGPHLLAGITRDVVLELAKTNSFDIKETAINIDELRLADEIWLTSSMREIMPVILLDKTSVGSGKPGPIWQKMNTLFQNYKQTLAHQ